MLGFLIEDLLLYNELIDNLLQYLSIRMRLMVFGLINGLIIYLPSIIAKSMTNLKFETA